jgi:ParB-like chromosome segregation protein Spo0J
MGGRDPGEVVLRTTGSSLAVAHDPRPRAVPAQATAASVAPRHLPPPTGSSETCQLVLLPIHAVLPADSPRLSGENLQHARLLAESDAELPPILVHRQTMRVIDGMHRLRAAVLRGQEKIAARLFDGGEDAAFVIAVETNVAHGLPLSLADREAAAARIVGSHPQWSDRAIASVTGLSAKTVAAIRRGTTGDEPQLHTRIGRDGRVRPVNGAEGRRRASELFAQQPNASLREVARGAGISPGTARDVRERIRRGEDPVPRRQRGNPPRPEPPALERELRQLVSSRRCGNPRDRERILGDLRRDPSLRFADSGRNLLRWLDARANATEGWDKVVPSMAPHCYYAVTDLACAIAEEWLDLAEYLRKLAESTA